MELASKCCRRACELRFSDVRIKSLDVTSELYRVDYIRYRRIPMICGRLAAICDPPRT